MGDTDDPITHHFLEVGKRFSKLMGSGLVQRCNCMVRQSQGSDQLPAIRKGRGRNAKFFTPEGYEIASVVSYEDMSADAIMKLLNQRGEEYIGKMF